MRYVKAAEFRKARRIPHYSSFPNIHVTGSVKGMQKIYRWPRGGQVRVGSYIYNIGTENVQKLRDAGVLRGEK